MGPGKPQLPPIDRQLLRALKELQWRLAWYYFGTKPEDNSQRAQARHNFGAAVMAARKIYHLLRQKIRNNDVPPLNEPERGPAFRIIKPKPGTGL